mmetsp:Transcript_13060/g.36040  ORF Transcript_13060/g.36040 Transcript_13060/m.36040 type:complete len:267 (+) Transcript_13060:341-1141(+)
MQRSEALVRLGRTGPSRYARAIHPVLQDQHLLCVRCVLHGRCRASFPHQLRVCVSSSAFDECHGGFGGCCGAMSRPRAAQSQTETRHAALGPDRGEALLLHAHRRLHAGLHLAGRHAGTHQNLAAARGGDAQLGLAASLGAVRFEVVQRDARASLRRPIDRDGATARRARVVAQDDRHFEDFDCGESNAFGTARGFLLFLLLGVCGCGLLGRSLRRRLLLRRLAVCGHRRQRSAHAHLLGLRDGGQVVDHGDGMYRRVQNDCVCED